MIKFKKYFNKKKEIGFVKFDEIKHIAQLDQHDIIKYFNLKKYGLDFDQAESIAKEYGNNSLKKKNFHWFLKLIKVLLNPFNIILGCIAIYNLMSYFFLAGDSIEIIGTIIILIMIFISSTISYIQEFRSYVVTKKLTELVSNTIKTIRLTEDEKVDIVSFENNIDLIKESKELEIHKLVQGDLIYLSSGNMIPADVRILWSNDLLINQSSLTGESFPVKKNAQYNESKSSNLLELQNICYTGTSVVSGSAITIAIGVGENTYYATILKTITKKRSENSFNKGIKKITWLLLFFMLVIVPIIFIINGVTKNNWLEALLFSVSVAVGLIPEMLPMIVNSNLARGASKMSKAKVVVKKLEAIQNLGAINILCTDKTGTLTKDNIEVVDYLYLDNKSDQNLLRYVYLNSLFQTGLNNPIDKAIINYVDKHHLKTIIKDYVKVYEIPFDFNRRKLTVVIKNKKNDHTLVCKGAIEEIINICSQVYYQGKIVLLTEDHLRMIEATTNRMNSNGLRVIGVAYKIVHGNNKYYSTDDESDLVFYGFISFLDKPKPSAAKMIKILNQNGVKLKILTGDNEQITRAICERVHLNIKGLVNGDYIDKLNDFSLREVVEKNNIFVKLNPLQKTKIIKALKLNNHSVGFMGDGINDAPVLRQSDVAISVDNATDIAKEASDIILLEKSLLVLEKGIIQGRQIFGNILKYIKITIASNFGNILSVLIASVWLPFVPLAPIQLLFQNLLYDMSQFTIAFDKVDKDFLVKPQTWSTKNIMSFVFINGPVSNIFDILTFLIIGYYFGVLSHSEGLDGNVLMPSLQQISLFHTGWFVEGLLTQILIVQMYRTKKIPFFQSKATWQLNVATIAIIAIGIILPYTVIATKIGLNGLPVIYFAFLTVIIVAYCLTSQLSKYIYIKIYKRWL